MLDVYFNIRRQDAIL